eukprot:6193822-Pleurochrysis_carterae.AAC.4
MHTHASRCANIQTRTQVHQPAILRSQAAIASTRKLETNPRPGRTGGPGPNVPARARRISASSRPRLRAGGGATLALPRLRHTQQKEIQNSEIANMRLGSERRGGAWKSGHHRAL